MNYLTLQRVAEIFNGFTDFSSGLAEAFFDVATGTVRSTFGFEIGVVSRPADNFFRLAFSLIEFAFDFVSIW